MKKALLGSYKNPHQRHILRGFTHFLLWHFGYYNDPFPPEPPPNDFGFPNPQDCVDFDKPLATWINHSTFWVRAFGKNILVDPIWNERCSPFNFIGPRRRHAPPMEVDEFEDLDIVILTHNHYDHMDAPTIDRLYRHYPQIHFVVPRGVKRWFTRRYPEADVVELEWWSEHEHEGLKFTGVPAQHFSGRGLFDRNRTLWMGVVVECEGKRIYFAGDTGYNNQDFKEIGQRFGSMDLSLLPIGAYAPRRFMRPVHVNPKDAVMIHQEVNSKQSLAGHWWTFRLSVEIANRPPYDLYCALQERGIDPLAFRAVMPGDSLNW
ncbi:MAG: hypothetical protein S4CHLAM81_03650 [Chlamydiales bacterium]|nr:hypothetical protein [Chlamydiales bacterium]MCH9635154.1 hypothetical protein [Chlamydiales bacterium]MCH9703275.1 MBL fold metallo-hydrolase [Chlamydiota bacterium]